MDVTTSLDVLLSKKKLKIREKCFKFKENNNYSKFSLVD